MYKTYRELLSLQTFEERFDYLKLNGAIGKATFGFERYLNQTLYTSDEWLWVRREIIIRDNGCDLGIEGLEIFSYPTVHHINPITIEDIEEGRPCVFDFNNLITSAANTHRAIHYGKLPTFSRSPIKRMKGDTSPWLMRQ